MTTQHETQRAAGNDIPGDHPAAPAPPSADWRARVRASRFGTPIVLALTLALVLGGTWIVNRPGGESAPQADAGTGKISAVQLKDGAGPAPQVGQPARDFSATTYDGSSISLASLRGRPVWLTFGASWCSSCRAEFPDIQATHAAATPGGLAVVGVYLSEDAPAVKAYADRLGLTYPQVPDPDTKIASAYRVMGVPAHLFIDRDGVIRSIDMGILSHDQIRERLALVGA